MALEDRELRTSGTPAAPTAGAVDLTSGSIPALPEDALILIPTRNLVLFPGTVLPITLGRQRSVMAAQAAMRLNRTVGLVLQRDPSIDDPIPVDLHRMGTEASLLRYVTSPDGGHHVICQGDRRFRILDFLDGYPFLAARVERIQEIELTSRDVAARLLNLRNQALEVLQLLPQTPAELVSAVQSVTSAAALADLIASFMDITPAEKQEILETIDLERRLERVSEMLAYRIDVLQTVAPDQRADQRRRSTIASANSCCASRLRRYRRSSARARTRRPRKSRSWRKKSPMQRCLPRSRSTQNVSSPGSSGCQRWPASIRWRAPTSNG